MIPPLQDPVEATARRVVDAEIHRLGTVWLPTLDEPMKVIYEVRQTNGFFRETSIQEMVLMRGKGREVQMRMQWDGHPQ